MQKLDDGIKKAADELNDKIGKEVTEKLGKNWSDFHDRWYYGSERVEDVLKHHLSHLDGKPVVDEGVIENLASDLNIAFSADVEKGIGRPWWFGTANINPILTKHLDPQRQEQGAEEKSAMYEPQPPDLSLDEQVRHARGFANGVCRNDHHVSRLLEQMARSIEGLLAKPSTDAESRANSLANGYAKQSLELKRVTEERDRLQARVAELEGENSRLKNTLKWYADRDNWDDNGRRARQVLALLEEPRKGLPGAAT